MIAGSDDGSSCLYRSLVSSESKSNDGLFHPCPFFNMKFLLRDKLVSLIWLVGAPAKSFLIGGERSCADVPSAKVPCAHSYFCPSSLDRMDGLPRELSTSRCGEKRWRLALPSFSRDLSYLSLLMDETYGRLQSSAYPHRGRVLERRFDSSGSLYPTGRCTRWPEPPPRQ